MRDAFVKQLCELAKVNKNIYLLTGDLGFNVLDKFWNDYPEQFINAGISEQNMTELAAGLAMEGKCCYTYSIGNFPTLRCLEQIRNDIAYTKANVNIVAVGGGFSYGALGMSHHATEDIAIMNTIPNMTIFTPCDPDEAAEAAKLSAKIDGPCYIRLARGHDVKIHHLSHEFALGMSNLLRTSQNPDAVIFVAGNIAVEAIKAADMLRDLGIHVELRTFFTVKPIDKNAIIETVKKCDKVITVEEHNIIGGIGSIIADVCAEYSLKINLCKLGLSDVFVREIGSQEYLREYYGISAKKIKEKIIDVLNKING